MKVFMTIGFISALILNSVPIAFAFQSGRTITGTVMDSNSQETLPGVNILVKGTSLGTVSDIDGVYNINITDPESILIFSFVGYLTQEIQVGNQGIIDVSLVTDQAQLDEVVVIGYGTARKSDLTGSVERINADNFKNQTMTQITDMLTGTVAGFNANQSTSAAGGSSLEVRGPTSLTAGTEPLIVLDGVIYKGSLQDINPHDIASMDILKDASSAAVFGSKAASGVILITTIKGKSSKPTINYSSRIGISEPAGARRPLGPDEYVQFRKDFFRTVFPNTPYHFYTNPNELPSDLSISDWRNLSNSPLDDNTQEYLSRLRFFPIEQESYLAGRTVNWYDVVMRKGMRQTHDLSIGGGSNDFSYYWSIGFTDNEGIRVGDEFSAIRSRLNVDFKVNDWLNVGVNTQFSDRDESAIPASMDFYSNSPFGREFDNEGNLERMPHGHTFHPLLDHYRQDRLRKVNSLFSTLYAAVKLPLGITYSVSFQPRYETMKDLSFTTTDIRRGGSPTEDLSRGSRNEFSHYEWMVDNLLKWNESFGVHSFDATLLFNVEETKRWSSQNSNLNFFPTEELGYHALQFGNNPSLSNDDYRSTGDAMMARLNYSLMDKYLITASVRRDGYSAFGLQNPRATFPALAFAWQIADEDFFDSNLINRLKMRLSWGVNGNRDIGMYASLARLQSNLWFDGTSQRVGVFNSTLANTGLRWERTESINMGFDIGLLEDRLDITLDYYDMTTTDLLMNRILPRITGFSNITSNLGELGNKGFETTINTVNFSRKNLTWKSSVVFSLNRNKIKRLFGDVGEYTLLGVTQTGEIPDYSNQWFPGQAIDVIWDYELLGVWQPEEIDDASVYGMRVGDFKAVDVDGNGVFTDLMDKQFIGFERPRYRVGLRNDFNFLTNFTASVFVRADLGHLGLYNPALNAGFESNDRRSRNVGPVPYWTPENLINDYARLDVSTSGYGGGLRIYKPQSFVRIQDISLAYNLPANIAKRIKLNNLRFFGSIRNFATFTKWPHWDPESGASPMPRIYTTGFSLSL
ncbi:MAG TPA: SusC/RagA family TonB-linked outer membrane protein [Lunatimonas sp.]|nr:SusC/RagA family TonB-linked outer membrane protein [Lunatimonas sp.]